MGLGYQGVDGVNDDVRFRRQQFFRVGGRVEIADGNDFRFPIVDANACICRLVLVMQRSSISIRMIVPTPDRARASAAQEPTPPMPTTAMRALLRRDSPLFPYRRPIPPNLAS